MGLKMEAASPEDRISSMVHTFVDTAVQIGSTLAVIEHNNREIFWWTSWAIGIVLGLFILHLLVRVHAQLVKLNACQLAFHQMWAEERENDERMRYEKRRERHMQEMEKKRVKTRRGALEEVAARMQAERQMENNFDDVLDGVGPIPLEGTPAHEEFKQDLDLVVRAVQAQARGN
ncbi:hypothetical protein F4782DRAFT_527523 [Xylaria castorea]|nr:hypothetical protein F4782DRAFT_527523 [Xylaria castorea]